MRFDYIEKHTHSKIFQIWQSYANISIWCLMFFISNNDFFSTKFFLIFYVTFFIFALLFIFSTYFLFYTWGKLLIEPEKALTSKNMFLTSNRLFHVLDYVHFKAPRRIFLYDIFFLLVQPNDIFWRRIVRHFLQDTSILYSYIFLNPTIT